MSKEPLNRESEGNLPAQWTPAEELDPPQSKRSFRKWDRSSFSSSASLPAASSDSQSAESESMETPVPSNLMEEQHKQEPLPAQPAPPQPVEEPDTSAETIAAVSEMVLTLAKRLPGQHAPPIAALEQQLSQGLIQVSASNAVILDDLQSYFLNDLDWSEHKVSSFVRPLLTQLKAMGLEVHQRSYSSAELPAYNTSTTLPGSSDSIPASPPQTNPMRSSSTTLNPMRSSSTTLNPMRSSSTSLQVSSLRSSATNNLPAFSNASPENPVQEEVPLPNGAVQATRDLVIECTQHSMLKTLLDMSVLEEYLDESLPHAWAQGEFDLQGLWTKLVEIPHVSEPLALSVFNEITKRESEWPYPLRLPKEVRKDLNKKVTQAPLAFRKSSTDKQAPSESAPTEKQAPKKKTYERQTSPTFVGLGIVLVLVGLVYLWFQFSGESLSGDKRDPAVYAKIVPMSEARFNKPNRTFYGRLSKTFMGWNPNKRVQAIFKLKKFVLEKDGARVLRLIRPNGNLYATLGRNR
ncbi:MAG: hypothetical protein EP343_08755 [Deltaproteobacteria bacterium]|nr:MAG: hypothetical protein EP343_08755 [Deltaproteobacteria bacterium]